MPEEKRARGKKKYAVCILHIGCETYGGGRIREKRGFMLKINAKIMVVM